MKVCREMEKRVMPFIEGRLREGDLEDFLVHIETCPECREELEIYYTVYMGLLQMDEEAGIGDIPAALAETLDLAWMRVRGLRLRKVTRYAVATLETAAVAVMMLMQLRIWLTGA